MAIELGFKAMLNLSYADALERVTAALKEEGFGVLTRIDVQATLKQKLGADFRPYTILGACNPPLAHRALQSNLDMGLLLPCNVIVYEEDEARTMVSVVNPMTMVELAPSEALQSVAREATDRLGRVINALREEGGRHDG